MTGRTTGVVPAPAATVVGGGPGGLMAAEVLAAAGVRVVVHEHMPSLGRKLLLAGRSGLNLTHDEPLEHLLGRYGEAEPWLRDAVTAFGPAALRAWAAGLGEETFVGSSGRVFPTAMRATPLLRAWLARLDDLGVEVRLRERWLGWAPPATGGRNTFRRADGSTYESTADVTVLALGGASWPRVGSDGGWVAPLRDAGITVTDLRPANAGMRVGWSAGFAERFAGTPLKNVAVAVETEGSAVRGDVLAGDAVRGDVTVTTTGLESGPIYTVAAPVRDLVERDGHATIRIDLHPDLDVGSIADRLRRRRPKDSLSTTLRRTVGLAPVQIALLRESTGNHIPVDSSALAELVKGVPIAVGAVMPLARAISTAGGIALDEIDDSFMLRRIPGTFVAGEMLDWEAPTGGYLLQATFSTAVAAAHGTLRWMGLQATPMPSG